MSSNKIAVHLDPCTINCHKVLGALDHMKVPYDLVHVDYFKGEQKSDKNIALNPSATVPFAVIKDRKTKSGAPAVITESNAILQYAADSQDDDSFYPKDLFDRATVNRWLLWESCAWFPSCYVYVVENVVKPLMGNKPDESVLDGESARMHSLCKILDEQLKQTKCIAGDNLTIADFAVAAPMHLYEESKLPLENYPNLSRWYKEEMEGNKAWMDTQEAVMVLVPNSPKNKKNAAKTNGVNGANGHSNGTVTASFNYTKEVEGKPPTLYFYDDPKASTIREPGDDPKDVTIHDGWSKANQFSIDKEGFALKEFKTEFKDWEDEERVRKEFYPQVVEWLKENVGVKRVLVFDHTIRSAKNDKKKLTQETGTSQRSPVMLVHCDYTAESGPLRIKQLMPDEAEELLKGRAAFINVWKPLNVVEEKPLAMCDVTTSPPEDFLKLYLQYRDRVGENYVMRHSDSQKWYYFPKMNPDQVILLKTFDNATDGTARFVGHTAFVDPTSAPDAPQRESCEIRTIVFY